MNTRPTTAPRDDFWRILGAAVFVIVAVVAGVPSEDPAAAPVQTAQAGTR